MTLNALLWFSRTHTAVRFTTETLVMKRLPRTACSDQADGEVEKDTVTFNEEKGEDTVVGRT